MQKKPIIQRLAEAAKGTVLRFPLTISFLAVLTIQMIYLVVAEENPDALTFFLAVGLLVGLLYHLCAEEVPEGNKGKINTALGIALAALAGDSIALHVMDKISDAMAIAQSAAILALVVATCFLPFHKEKDDRKSWNFVFNLMLSGAIGYVVGGIMLLGLTFLYAGSCELFGITSESKVYGVMAVLCLITLPVLLFLIRIPEGERKNNNQLPKNRFVLGISRYLFLPLVLLYMAVLYVYGAKILFTWELPHGTLAGMVSALMMGIVGLTFLLYPYLNDSLHKGFEKKVMRWILPAVLPLLVLMSIGLGRRLMDYGITANRLYVLTLNVWFYAVAIGLWISKARRIHWISISFAIILIATSCHPLNYTNIARNVILGRFDKALAAYPIEKSKTIGDDDLRKYFLSVPETAAHEQYRAFQDCARLDYDYYAKKLGSPESGPSHLYSDYEDFMGIETKEDKEAIMNSLAMDYQYEGAIAVPQGYKQMMNFSIDQAIGQKLDEKRKDIADQIFELNEKSFKLSIADYGVVEIKHADLKNDKYYTYTLPDKKAVLIINRLDLWRYNKDRYNCSMSGHLFYN